MHIATVEMRNHLWSQKCFLWLHLWYKKKVATTKVKTSNYTNHELERSWAEAAGSATQHVQTAENLQHSVDALKVKDDAIGRLQAQVVAAEKKPQKALKLKDNVIGKLAENNLLSNGKA